MQKDQVVLLNQDLENKNNDLKKIEAKNLAEVEHERKAAAYWKEEVYFLLSGSMVVFRAVDKCVFQVEPFP